MSRPRGGGGRRTFSFNPRQSVESGRVEGVSSIAESDEVSSEDEVEAESLISFLQWRLVGQQDTGVGPLMMPHADQPAAHGLYYLGTEINGLWTFPGGFWMMSSNWRLNEVGELWNMLTDVSNNLHIGIPPWPPGQRIGHERLNREIRSIFFQR